MSSRESRIEGIWKSQIAGKGAEGLKAISEEREKYAAQGKKWIKNAPKEKQPSLFETDSKE